MDQKIPFTNYDFWAYLSSGFLLLFALDQACKTGIFAKDTWTVVNGVLAFSVAYATGQLIASFSSLFLERGLVGKLLGYPSGLLLGERRGPAWARFLIPEYFKPLPESVRLFVISKAESSGVRGPASSIYWSAYAVARASTQTSARLDNFLNLYGFCRNCALAGFLCSGLMYWSYLQPLAPAQHLLWARLALLLGIGMTFRYLKFFRHFCIEVMTAYAFASTKEAAK